ncbi:hypothetical protein HS088_TW10G00546 [Tripterygium wilfordii]|uniref:Uncharacterized protein n=1 Tax=Tripterygium wilfordii TaxID=458696 RepID=A0A7J7D656_TRIWF|nr:hypothetical protein HS088_TW10G00546 [Tripterygium wilfordii]
MATERVSAVVTCTHNHKEGIQEHLNDPSPSLVSNQTKDYHYGKALAHRALHGSSSQRGVNRKVRTNDAMASPSRLSKVTLADDADD